MPDILDLNGFMPKMVNITMGERTLEVSTDLPPLLMGRINTWLGKYGQALLAASETEEDLALAQDVEAEGWAIGEAVVGEDLHPAGFAALVAVLTFFRDHYMELFLTIWSGSRSALPEPSTEASPSPTSSEVPAS